MPLYEYSCRLCGAKLEVMQKFSDEPLTVHDGCGGELEKLISTSAIQFKGKGWYVTDYGRSSGPNGKEPKKESKESKAESKSEAKTESKPAAKPDSKA